MLEGEMPFCFNQPTERQDLYGFLSLLLNGYLTCFCVVAGVVGNIGSICMVPKLRLGKEFLCYLVTLAIWDTTVLMCAFGYYSMHTILAHFGLRISISPYLTQILNGPSTTSMTGSIWTVVAITVARYCSISNPIKHRARASRRRTVVICGGILFLATLFTLPYYFEIIIIPCRSGPNGTTVSMDIAPSTLRADKHYKLIYRSLLASLFISLVPFASVLGLSLRIIWILRQKAKQDLMFRETLKSLVESSHRSRAKKNERRVSRLFFVLLGKFLGCYSLPAMLNVIEMMVGQAVVFREIYFALMADISNFLVVLNSATNFIVYFWWRYQYQDSGSVKQLIKNPSSKSLIVRNDLKFVTSDAIIKKRSSSLPMAVRYSAAQL